VALAAGIVMALGLGWVAVRAVGPDHEERRSAAATTLAAEPRAAAATPEAPPATAPPAVLSPAASAVTLPPAPRVRATPPAAETSPAPAEPRPTAAPATAPARPRVKTTPAPDVPERVVVHPEVGPAIPATDAEHERLARARRMALDLAQSRREALARRVQRLQDQLAVIEDPDALADMQARLEEATQQLDAAEKEVARLRGEGSE
jgi:hypothetical protein